MKSAAIDAFLRAQGALDLALDGNDLRAIEMACDHYRSAIFAVRASGAWSDHPKFARTAVDLLGRVELAQQRVKNLTRQPRIGVVAAAPIPPGDTAWQSEIAA